MRVIGLKVLISEELGIYSWPGNVDGLLLCWYFMIVSLATEAD
jgi:hypothetical protein